MCVAPGFGEATSLIELWLARFKFAGFAFF